MVSVLTHFHLTRNLWVRCSYQVHFTDEECQALRGWLSHPQSHDEEMAEQARNSVIWPHFSSPASPIFPGAGAFSSFSASFEDKNHVILTGSPDSPEAVIAPTTKATLCWIGLPAFGWGDAGPAAPAISQRWLCCHLPGGLLLIQVH